MNLNEIMEFLESEYIVINNTPCEVCGGDYLTDSVGLTFDGIRPQNLTICVCEDCGHKKEFVFHKQGFWIQVNKKCKSDTK